MTTVPRSLTVSRALSVALATVMLIALVAGANAQHYDGCFVNGQQVSDSMCNGGTSGTGGGDAAMGAAGSLGFAIGAGLGGALRNMLLNDNGGAPSSRQLNDRGVALFAQGRLQEAAEAFRQALAVDPDDGVVRANYFVVEGQLAYHAGDLDKARELAMRAVQIGGGPLDLAKHDLGVYNQAIAARSRAASQRAERQFAAGQQGLIDQIRPVRATDGYVPHPAARLDSDPRTYPELPSYTNDQRIAHKMNQDGIDAAELHHNWADAMSSFAAAYDYDPVGPFSKVIRQNMAIAAKHLDEEQAARAKAAGIAANPQANRPPPSTQSADASAKLQATDAPPKQVLPKTYAECNVEFQARTNSCQRADGSWDREGCFKPAKTWFDGCVKGLTQASFR